MSQGIDIDFSALKPLPDPATTYANAFAAGRALAAQGITSNAMTAYGADPAAPVDPRLWAANPAQAEALTNRQSDAQAQAGRVQTATVLASGDTQGAMDSAASAGNLELTQQLRKQLDAVPDQQRAAAVAAAQARNEQFAHVLMGLKGATNPDGTPMSPPQRLAAAQHIAATSGAGIDPNAITLDDVTDAGINAHLASAMTIEQFLKHESDQAAATLKGQEFAETSRHNRADEGLSAARLGVEQRAEAYKERPQAGAGPGAPSGPASGAPAATARTIDQVPAGDRAMVQSFIDGRQAAPTGMALKNPDMLRWWNEANQVDPTLSAATYHGRANTYADVFSTKGKTSQTITALAQALNHGQLLAGDIDRLGNVTLPLGAGGVVNAIKNAATGPYTGTLKDFQEHAAGLSAEAAKVFQGGAPHEAEVAQQLKIIGDANASPVEQKHALASLTELLGGRLDAINQAYERSRSPAGSPLHVLSPDAAAAYSRLANLRNSLHGSAAGPRPSGAPASAPAGGRFVYDAHGNLNAQ